jgi:large subunit ribosomal protein L25
VPAVLYGKGAAATPLALDPKALVTAISGEMGKNVLLELNIDGQASGRAQLADYQVHPVTRELLHIDLLQVDDSVPVTRPVPLKLVGKAKGLIMGGVLRQVFREIPVRCLPAQLPAAISHDVSGLNIEDVVHVKDLTLPEGVTVQLKPEQTVGGVYGSRRQTKEEEDEATADAEKKAEPAAT